MHSDNLLGFLHLWFILLIVQKRIGSVFDFLNLCLKTRGNAFSEQTRWLREKLIGFAFCRLVNENVGLLCNIL